MRFRKGVPRENRWYNLGMLLLRPFTEELGLATLISRATEFVVPQNDTVRAKSKDYDLRMFVVKWSLQKAA